MWLWVQLIGGNSSPSHRCPQDCSILKWGTPEYIQNPKFCNVLTHDPQVPPRLPRAVGALQLPAFRIHRAGLKWLRTLLSNSLFSREILRVYFIGLRRCGNVQFEGPVLTAVFIPGCFQWGGKRWRLVVCDEGSQQINSQGRNCQ